MAKCFPQQFIRSGLGGAVQDWRFTVPKRGMTDSQCTVKVTNDTLEDQGIDPSAAQTRIDVHIPARKRNVLVNLSDINYTVTRVTLYSSGKEYYFATNGGSQVYRGD